MNELPDNLGIKNYRIKHIGKINYFQFRYFTVHKLFVMIVIIREDNSKQYTTVAHSVLWV